MKSIKIFFWSILAIAALVFNACTEPLGGDVDLGDTHIVNEYGDVISTSTVITTTTTLTFQVTITRHGDTVLVNNGQIINVAPGGIFHIGDNTYHWNPITNTVTQVTVINQHFGNVIKIENGGILNNGTIVNGNVIHDNSTNTTTTITHVTNVGGDYWVASSQNNTTNTNTWYIWNSTTNSWSVVNNNQVYNYTSCCPTCQTDTVVVIVTVVDTVHTTSVDTVYQVDTLIQVIPDGYKAIALKRLEDSWMVKNLCMSAEELLSGGADTLRVALRWGNTPTFGNFQRLSGPANGVYQYRSTSLHANQSVNFTLNDVTSGNLPLTTGISDCAQSGGAAINNPAGVYNQTVGISLIGTPPSAWVGGNYQLKFQWGTWNSANYVPFTQELRNMINVMGGLDPTIDGWILVKEVRANGQPAKLLNVAKMGDQYDDVEDYIFP